MVVHTKDISVQNTLGGYIYIYIIKIVALDYSGILYSFSQGGTGVTFPLLCALMALSVALFCCGLPLFWVSVTDSFVCAGVVEVLGWCGGILWGLESPGSAYLNRFSPAPFFHWGKCTLIRCAGTLESRMHQCVACTKVMAILLLTYPHVRE